jgi:dTDP-4-amino-4,6-dideoxygalactose transaminase
MPLAWGINYQKPKSVVPVHYAGVACDMGEENNGTGC